MDKQKERPISCSECKYLKQSKPEDEKLWAKCETTGEQLNPFELCYSTGIGKKCTYYQKEHSS